MTSRNEKGREVLQHPTTQEAATLFVEQCADYDRLTIKSTTIDQRAIFSDEYVAALAEANAHPEELA